MQGTSFIRPDAFWHDLGLRAGQSVVHLGCGPGFYLIPAAKIVGMSGKAIGVDILPNMLEEVEGRAMREGLGSIVHTIRSNLENASGSTLPAASADWVLVANILHQSAPDKILQEAARIVKPTGNVVIVEWDTAATPFGPPVDVRMAKPDVMHLLEPLGLQLQEEFQPSPYHYGLLLTRKK